MHALTPAPSCLQNRDPIACAWWLPASYPATLRSGPGLQFAPLLPINAMRNAALLPAMDPLVAMVDVDLMASHFLSNMHCQI